MLKGINNMKKTQATTKKMLPVYILEILKKYTDAEHVFTQKEIAQKLKEDCELEIERKAIGRNIKLLCEADYEIETRNGKGFCFLGRPFEDTELRFLIDCVRFSRCVNKSVADSMCRRLAEFGTVTFREETQLLEIVSPDNKNKTIALFHTIDVLKKAIFNNRKVAFQYFEYRTDKNLQPAWDEWLIVSPRELVYPDGNYYLIGQIEGKNAFTNFQLDKVRNAKLLKEGCDKNLALDLKQYLSAHPLMYSGEPLTAILKVKRFLMHSVWEFFGADVTALEEGNSEKPNWIEITVHADSQSIMEFALDNGYFAEVLSPDALRRDLKEMAHDMFKKYSNAQVE